MSEQETIQDYHFAAGGQFLDSIRSSGYKNVARALAELVDNSIQAGASDVDILVSEHEVTPQQYTVNRVNEIAVLDDGEGMEKDLLRRALRLGDGTHFDDRSGIGKFGVGLPQASVSQAKRIDVWTWQDGIDNAYHTYIDLDDDEWVRKMEIPEPEQGLEIPGKWREMSSFDQDSGTLVVWSQVDRINWKKGKTIHQHSEDLIGRMYRNWLHPDADKPVVSISLKLYHEGKGDVTQTWEFKPNDPLYRMDNTNVELPDGVPDPMFERVGDKERVYEVTTTDGGTTEEKVKLTFSICKPEARKRVDGGPAGSAIHGKHAKDNMGLSIVREGRELLLDRNWASDNTPTERWWGVQIDFGRQMDEIFGVTNNKQGADRLVEIASSDWDDYAQEGESTQQTKERLKEEDFPTFVCLDIKNEIDTTITQLRKKVKEIGEYNVEDDNKQEDKRHEDTPERVGTEVTKDRKEQGQTGESDEQEELSENEKEEEIESRLKDQGIDDQTIEQVKGDVVDYGLKFSFVEKHLTSSQIFSVEPTAGSIIIGVNKDHLAYDELFSSLELEDEDEIGEEEAAKKLQNANMALKLLLEAWARMEDEETTDMKHQLRDIREDWGRVAREFLMRDQVQE